MQECIEPLGARRKGWTRTLDQIRVIHWGLGAMGSGIARLVQQKRGLRSAGAVERSPARHGRDLGALLELDRDLGVKVVPSFADLDRSAVARGDIVLHATASFARDVAGDIIAAVEAGLNVITTTEEMAFPWAGQPEIARRIDEAARTNAVTVLGTGVNPGFVLDTLIIALTGACERVDSIRAARINDLSAFGPTVLSTQGVGTTPEEFARGLASGTIVGHVGFPQSMAMIAGAIGWRIDRIEEEREPIISQTHRRTPYVEVRPGMVAGCRHVASGFGEGRLLIKLEHPQQVHPQLEDVETGDYIWIDGLPPVSLRIKPELPGGTGTIAVVVNMIPAVVAAPPGLVDMSQLPVPRAMMGDLAGAGFPVR